MDATLPWYSVLALIQPVYYKPTANGGRPPLPLEVMLRIHLLQQWFTLSDPLMEEMLIDTPCFRRFAGIDMIEGRIPDETTILAFRHLLEKHNLGEQILETVKAHLRERGMAMKQGTIIDATLIAAPSSTLERAQPECIRSTRIRTAGCRRQMNSQKTLQASNDRQRYTRRV